MKRLLLSAALIVLTVSPARSQEPPPAPTASQAAFDALFKDWKSMLARMRTLQEQYQVARPGDRPAIEAEFNELREKGRKMAPQLLAAAEEAYLSGAKGNSPIGDYLMANFAEEVSRENYEEALRLGKILLDKGYSPKSLAPFLGMAMYATNDFENAAKYLKQASEEDTLKNVKPAAQALAGVDQKAAQWPEEARLRAAETEANDLPRVKLTTSQGDIVLELFENEAPNTVANFISLVEKGFYNGLKFHRVIPGFMAQGGCPLGTGTGGPGYTIDCETSAENHRKHFRGSISMAHAGPNTGGSQFFLSFVPTLHLDGMHTVFGRVVEGMNVLARIQRPEEVSQRGPPDKIIKAEVLRKRDHEYKPVTKSA